MGTRTGFYTRLGELLRTLRFRAGLSQAALGARIGRSPSAVARYEMGQRKITPADLPGLARALNVRPEVFLTVHSAGRRPRERRAGERLTSLDRLRAEHQRLLRALDQRLAYPNPSLGTPSRVREAAGRYSTRTARAAADASPKAYVSALPAKRLQAWARRAGWRGRADPNVLRRYAGLILTDFAHRGLRDRG